jgi:hypothetical protein
LNAKDGSGWVAKIIAHMPDAIRQRTQEKLDLYFELQPDTVKSMDEANEGFAFHYHTWFRNTTSVSGSRSILRCLFDYLLGTKTR